MSVQILQIMDGPEKITNCRWFGIYLKIFQTARRNLTLFSMDVDARLDAYPRGASA